MPDLPSFDPLDPSMSGDGADPELLRVDLGRIVGKLRGGLERARVAGDGAGSRAYAEVLGVLEPIAHREVDEFADVEVLPVRPDAADGDPAGVVAALDIIRAECRKEALVTFPWVGSSLIRLEPPQSRGAGRPAAGRLTRDNDGWRGS